MLVEIFQTSSGGSSGQQQNDTSLDAMVERRRRRAVEKTESSSKVKRETDPKKPEKLQSDLVNSTIHLCIMIAL